MKRSMRALPMGLMLAACASPAAPGQGDPTHASSSSETSAPTVDASSSAAPACETLYGRPNEASGLTSAQCAPSCPCLGGWVAPEFDAARLEDLRARVLIDPPTVPVDDPYQSPEDFPDQPGQACAVVTEAAGYRVQTFADEAAADLAGAVVTHTGACGLCSSLADLAVYAGTGDLTEPVRQCGVEGIGGGDEVNLACLLELGFSPPCAQIWLFNTKNTRTVCLDVCLAALDDPYHLPDGSLNACLQCDEDSSGPVFKAVAGRTRRNSGLASALCRPCESVETIDHVYP